ncbi:MAG: UbiA family prenyltransferase [Flavobacteriales bacterium]|nr:UbiA family prenyltransferase [Flavobacteriales bacterium]
MLSIIRWPVLLFTALVQYVTAIYVFTPNKNHWEVLADYELHFIVLSTAFMLAAGFIINSFYDFEKDLINRPDKTLFNRVVSKEFCLNTYLVFNGLGLIFSALASWRVLLFFAAFAFWLWFYSHKLQKIPVVREVVAVVLSVVSVFSIALYYQYWHWIMPIFGAFFTCILFNREIIKDLKNHDGDMAVGNQSISTKWGRRAAKAFFSTISFLAIMLLLSFYKVSEGKYALHFAVGISAIVVFSTILLLINKKPNTTHIAYKLILFMSVLYLILGYR